METSRLVGAGRQLLRAVWLVLVGGGKPDPRRRSRTRVVVVVAMAAWTVFIGTQAVPILAQGSLFCYVVAFLAAATVLLTLWRPLWAWRLLAVLLVVTPDMYPGLLRFWGWPWAPAVVMAAVIVLYAVASRHSQAVEAAVGTLTAVLVAVQLSDWRDAFLGVGLMIIPLVLGSSIRERRLAEKERSEQQRLRLAEEARGAVLDERARIARELHDIVAHHMSVLALRADSARYRYPGLSPELIEEFAAQQATAREGMTEMRRLLGVLRTESPETMPQPGAEQLAELTERMREAGSTVKLALHGDYDALPAGVALSAYRIIQEALSNAARHAPGGRISIEVDIGEGLARITVRNTAGGNPPHRDSERPGHGLLGMRERAMMLGGTFRAGPEDGGFVVRATLPLGDPVAGTSEVGTS